MALTQERGSGLVELLHGILILALLSTAIFSSIRALQRLHRRSLEFSRLETSRDVIKSIYGSALLGASRYLPEPLFLVSRASKHLPFPAQGELLTVVEAYPNIIYQASDTSDGTDLYCAHETSLPAQDFSSSTLAIGIGLSEKSVVKLSTDTAPSAGFCTDGRVTRLKVRDISTPLFDEARSKFSHESLIPLRDLYSLYLDSNSQLRRFSYATGEHQTLLSGVEKLSLELLESCILRLRFKLIGISNEEEILLSFSGGRSADWLDLIW